MKIERLIEVAILLSIDSIREDIQKDIDAESNKIRAEAIAILAHAFREVKYFG